MIDWLRRDSREDPAVEIGDRKLPIVVRRLARARQLTMRLAPDGSEVRISIPRWTQTSEAIEFAQGRRDWIARQLAQVPPPRVVASGSLLPVRGGDVRLRHSPDLPRKPKLLDGTLEIGGPENSVRDRVRRWLEAEARQLVAGDVARYCGAADREIAKSTLTRAKRRWGSCAPDGTIRINWRLVMAPDEIRRSVVAHEVAHLVHFDHSPQFHALLGRLFEGDIDEANDWLKREGRGLYAWFG